MRQIKVFPLAFLLILTFPVEQTSQSEWLSVAVEASSASSFHWVLISWEAERTYLRFFAFFMSKNFKRLCLFFTYHQWQLLHRGRWGNSIVIYLFICSPSEDKLHHTLPHLNRKIHNYMQEMVKMMLVRRYTVISL